MKDLTAKTAIVTGASSGIGKAITERLAGEGANVVLASRSKDKLDQVAEGLPTESLVVPTDVGKLTNCEALVAQTMQRFGKIDLLINNAGIDAFIPFEQVPADYLEQVVATNLTGAMQLTRLVVPTMLEQSSGHVLNVSSTSGKFGAGYGAAYAATKAGLVGFTRSLRAEYHNRGICASVLCPGFTDAGGIYERIKSSIGRGTPTLMGKTSDAKVATAAIRAIRRNKPEMIVNSIPMRPICAIQEAFPRLGGWIVRKTSLRWLRRVATSGMHDSAGETRAAA